MKTIIFASCGDSRDISEWSNVPYLFSKALENKGIKIVRINIAPNRYLQSVWNLVFRKMFRGILGEDYVYYRSLISKIETDCKLWLGCISHRDADWLFILSYKTNFKLKRVPTLLFSDWTYKIFQDRRERIPTFFNRMYIKNEHKAITEADYTISLFPECARQMQQDCPDANILYLENNVINVLYDNDINQESIIERKMNSNNIVFIGREEYIEGANLLIDSVSAIKDTELEVDIIGLTKSDFPNKELPSNVRLYGFLHKDDEVERNLYYNLIMNARIYVNPTTKWGAYSSTIESMFFYTPVIVSPYNDFVSEFGDTINFGFYNRQYSIDSLVDNIKKILELPWQNYYDMCVMAHDRVKDYTWDNYVSKLLNIIDKK